MPRIKSPPSGQRTMGLSSSELETLRRLLLKRGGSWTVNLQEGISVSESTMMWSLESQSPRQSRSRKQPEHGNYRITLEFRVTKAALPDILALDIPSSIPMRLCWNEEP